MISWSGHLGGKGNKKYINKFDPNKLQGNRNAGIQVDFTCEDSRTFVTAIMNLGNYYTRDIPPHEEFINCSRKSQYHGVAQYICVYL
jgi:hypothetical protein